MLTCKDASRLISDGMDRPLRLPQRLGLSLHLAICGACRRMRTQMHWLRAGARLYPEALADEDRQALPPAPEPGAKAE